MSHLRFRSQSGSRRNRVPLWDSRSTEYPRRVGRISESVFRLLMQTWLYSEIRSREEPGLYQCQDVSDVQSPTKMGWGLSSWTQSHNTYRNHRGRTDPRLLASLTHHVWVWCRLCQCSQDFQWESLQTGTQLWCSPDREHHPESGWW